jgi:hypothetical protein
MGSEVRHSGQARLVSRACAVPLLWLLLPDPARSAGGAFLVDDADVAPLGTCESENFVSAAANHDLTGLLSTACTVKIGVPTELSPYYQGSVSGGLSTSVYGLQAKVLAIDTATYGLSTTAGSFVDTATRTVSGFLNVPMTYEFTPTFRIHLDTGWLHDSRVNNIDYATGGVGFEWDFLPTLSLQGEVYIQQGRQSLIAPPRATSSRTQLGLQWTPSPKVDLDLIFGKNVDGKGGNWITLGVNFRPQAQ